MSDQQKFARRGENWHGVWTVAELAEALQHLADSGDALMPVCIDLGDYEMPTVGAGVVVERVFVGDALAGFYHHVPNGPDDDRSPPGKGGTPTYPAEAVVIRVYLEENAEAVRKRVEEVRER